MKKFMSSLAVLVMVFAIANLASTPVKADTKNTKKGASSLVVSASVTTPLPYITNGCGAGSSIVGTDNKFVITMGDVPSVPGETGCTVSFGTPQASQPVCVLSDDTDAINFTVVSSTTSVTFDPMNINQINQGSKVSVLCQ